MLVIYYEAARHVICHDERIKTRSSLSRLEIFQYKYDTNDIGVL